MANILLPANMQQCPACSIIIEKIDGDNTMMCGCEGRPAGGNMEKAIRNGGCGCEFNFQTLVVNGDKNHGHMGHPANNRQINFVVQGGALPPEQPGQPTQLGRQLAEEMEFTGFTFAQRIQALAQNDNNKERAIDWLFQGGAKEQEKVQENQQKEIENKEQIRQLLAREMVVMGFELNACLEALSQHNNNQESALNWLCTNAPIAATNGSQQQRPTKNKDAVQLDTMKPPSVNDQTILANTRPDNMALEMQRQQMIDDPSIAGDIQCFRCHGTGVRQNTTEGDVGGKQAEVTDANDNNDASLNDRNNIVVPALPFAIAQMPIANAAVALPGTNDDDLDMLPVAVVLRIASGEDDMGELRRATSLDRYMDGNNSSEEDNEEREGERKNNNTDNTNNTNNTNNNDNDTSNDIATDSITLQTFSAEELGLLRGDRVVTEGKNNNEAGMQRTPSRKIKRVTANQRQHVLIDETACWLCEGTGRLSKMFGQLDVATTLEEGEEAPECGICWCDPAEYGLSSTCGHVFCRDCLSGNLNNAMDQGIFPAFCPECKASAGEGKNPPCGLIDGAALSFLAQRDVITHDFQFRFMRQQKEIERMFFHCPSRCGRILLEPAEVKWLGDRNNPYAAPGECECGTLVCVTCHQELVPNQIKKHVCPANRLGKDMTENELILLHERGIRKCPKCGAFIQKNEGCHIMMCGTNAHGKIEEARRRGGCGYEGHWNTYVGLIERNIANVDEKHRTYSSSKKGHEKSALDSKPGWCSKTDKAGEWLTLDLGKVRVVAGVRVQGRDCSTPNKNEWWRFKEFSVTVSNDGKNFDAIDNSSKFKGPADSWTKTDRIFQHAVHARYVRLTIHSWYVHLSGRVDIIIGNSEDLGIVEEKPEGKQAQPHGETKTQTKVVEERTSGKKEDIFIRRKRRQEETRRRIAARKKKAQITALERRKKAADIRRGKTRK